ncbi:hypothetical protein PCANC_21066 [Puccinia coronata f. sp. avenae]|uniref:Tet-like 2OG-Fe(II) oxygenase domain-containing protein n=1 Tax=Puccinia coronata f. sp. avenae TaxID=200324 RepID=A0A2N5TV85_9BASI|nr:hypothetical protein PCASD_17599 [Puccinia coronata f. sp. avenae]PLW31496.1 hypothetical protein PCANC_21066 [Puccinia coronata f. sp. avenae]
MAAYELIGRYRNQQAILEAPDFYNMAMQCSSAASDILGQMFRKLANVAFEDNQEQMTHNHIPALATLDFSTPLQELDCAPNLTFTEDGFLNHPHCDTEDISEFAFGLFIPISKETGQLVDLMDDYHFAGGSFVFPDFKFGLDFSRHKGISLQINKRTSNASRDIENGTILDRPSNKNKNPDDMFIGDHKHLLPDPAL